MTIIIKILATAAVVFVLLSLVIFFFQDKMLFFPDQTDFKNCSLEQVGFRPVVNEEYRYYWKRADSNKYIVAFHGNGGRACDRGYLVEAMDDTDYNLILFEYPGYAGDDKKSSEKSILKSARQMLESIKAQHQEAEFHLMGESLGSAVATIIATEFSARSLVLFAPLTSISEMASYHYPWLPVKWLLQHPFHADRAAPNFEGPVLIFHGDQDNIIPIRIGDKQSKNFTSSELEFVTLGGTGHNDMFLRSKQQIHKTLVSFYAKY